MTTQRANILRLIFEIIYLATLMTVLPPGKISDFIRDHEPAGMVISWILLLLFIPFMLSLEWLYKIN